MPASAWYLCLPLRKLPFFLVLLVHTCICVNARSSGCTLMTEKQEQRRALEALYNSTNGSNWWYNHGWLRALVPYCDWTGIHCGGVDPCDVTRLDLPATNLHGLLRGELSAMTALQELDLTNNPLLSGIPPKEWSAMSNLQ